MKKALSVALLGALALTAVGGTLAYFTDNDTAVNTFTIGNVDIELLEPKWVEPDNVTPGVKYDKDPSVKNIGNNDAWIRVDVELSDAAAFMAAAENHNIEDLTDVFDIPEDFDEKWELAGTSLNSAADTLTYSYYYKEILAADKETSKLFTAVTVPAAFNNAEIAALGDEFTITVYAHAIQTADAYNTAADAFASYAEETNAFTSAIKYEGGANTLEITSDVASGAATALIRANGGTLTIKGNEYCTVTATGCEENGAIYAQAVRADKNAIITIEGGNFRNSITTVPEGENFDLIYASNGGKIVITGGTFQSVTPAWTLNLKDNTNSSIVVKGGSFYKFDPSNGHTEPKPDDPHNFLADGYKVVKNGEWYKVVKAD